MIPVMIDSGAYTAYTQGREINLDAYIEFLHGYLKKFPDHPIVYVNLDVIGDGKGSYDNWVRMRKAGLAPLPVYHVNTPIKWLQEYLKEVDYVGIGAIANLSSERRLVALDRIWSQHLVDTEGMPKAKVHGMGIAGFPLLKRYPWYTVDSTTWVLIAGYGGIYYPVRRAGVWRYDLPPLKLFTSDRSPTVQEKGKHYQTLSPVERGVVDAYLEFVGETMDGEGGLAVNVNARSRVNIRFLAEYVRGLAWPRRLVVPQHEGLLE